jgi:PilZ domain
MATSSVIIADLKNCLLDSNWDFDILNAYHGVQFLCKAVLASVGEDKAIFKVSASPCATLLEVGKRTFVLSNNLADPLQATVASYEPASGKLELNDFTYAGTNVGSRREFRVEPAEVIKLEIEFEGKTFAGRLGDISMSGAGFYIDKPTGADFRRGEAVSVNFHLPAGDVQLPAVLRSVEKVGEGPRLAVEFTENVPQKAAILRYINQRQVEIRTEVQQRYEALFPLQKK